MDYRNAEFDEHVVVTSRQNTAFALAAFVSHKESRGPARRARRILQYAARNLAITDVPCLAGGRTDKTPIAGIPAAGARRPSSPIRGLTTRPPNAVMRGADSSGRSTGASSQPLIPGQRWRISVQSADALNLDREARGAGACEVAIETGAALTGISHIHAALSGIDASCAREVPSAGGIIDLPYQRSNWTSEAVDGDQPCRHFREFIGRSGTLSRHIKGPDAIARERFSEKG